MNISLTSKSHGPFVLEANFPGKYKEFLLQGSQPFSATGSFGTILIQQFTSAQFSIRYILFDLLKRTDFQWTEDNFLCCRLPLSHEFNYERNGEAISLKPSQYNLVWAPGKQSATILPEGRSYRFINALYSPSLVQKLLPSFFNLHHKQIEKKAFWVEPEMTKAITEILESPPFKANTLDFFFENKVREILFATLHKGVGKFFEGSNENILSAIYSADKIILENLNHHFTNKELARKVGINQLKLKRDFKKVIGVALYKRLHEARMEKARHLILYTDKPIKVIHELVGYTHLTNFITAFRKHFGETPAELKRRSS